MGNPRHYSVEIPQRCLQLIDELWPYAEKTEQPHRPDVGPLTSTFLISMSMPIINLPVERIERYRSAKLEGYADDRHIDASVTAAVDTILGAKALSTAPFYSPNSWSFAKYSTQPLFNVARSLPPKLAQELRKEAAFANASRLQTSQWCGILRNAMAHGGIAYLDENGETTYDRPVKMYAFISAATKSLREPPNALNILRISETDFRAFLQKWVGWIESSGLNAVAA